MQWDLKAQTFRYFDLYFNTAYAAHNFYYIYVYILQLDYKLEISMRWLIVNEGEARVDYRFIKTESE